MDKQTEAQKESIELHESLHRDLHKARPRHCWANADGTLTEVTPEEREELDAMVDARIDEIVREVFKGKR